MDEGRFEFLTMLRAQAIKRAQQDHPRFFEEAEIDVTMMQRQFEIIDGALVATLKAEGRLDTYSNWKRTTDPDLPTDPQALSDPRIAYKYALKRLYRRQFETVVNERKSGCWPLIEFDLLAPIDGKRILLVEVFREAVTRHPSSDFVLNMPIERLQEVQSIYADVVTEVQARALKYQTGLVDNAVRAARDLLDAYYCQANDTLRELCAARDRIERAEREAREAKERAALKEYHDRFGREPREIPGASDYVDHFDRNHERIGRTC